MDGMKSVVVCYEEAATALQIGRRTVANLIRRGLLDKVVPPGGKKAYGVTRASLERLIAQSTQYAPAAEVEKKGGAA